jgi:hypothetical protein
MKIKLEVVEGAVWWRVKVCGSRTRRLVELTARNSPRTPYCFRASRAKEDESGHWRFAFTLGR